MAGWPAPVSAVCLRMSANLWEMEWEARGTLVAFPPVGKNGGKRIGSPTQGGGETNDRLRA